MSSQNGGIGAATKEVDYDIDVDLQEVRERMVVARYKLLTNEPFYGTIAINMILKPVEKDHKHIRTTAVDGRHMYYHPNFIAALDDEELLFLIAHNVMRLALNHLTRRGKRDMESWYAAGSYLINHILVRDRVGKFPAVGGLYDENYANMVTEELYEIIHNDRQGGGGGGCGPGQAGNFDDYIEVEIGGDSSDDGDPSEGKMSMSEDEAAELENEMIASVMQAVDATSKQAGKVPGEIERLIKEFTEPKMNWRDVVRETAKSQVTSDYTWKRPNRKFLTQGFVMPSLTVEDHFEFVIGIDASGSMSNDELRDYLSEIYAISDAFMSFKIGIFTFDTKVYNYQEYDQDTIEDLLDYTPNGGGGTDFMCIWKYLKDNDIVPETLIVLTDGMPFSSWGDPEYCPTVFVIHGQHGISNKITAPFGTTLYYDDYQS